MEDDQYYLCDEEEAQLFSRFMYYRRRITDLENVFQVTNPYQYHYCQLYALFQLMQHQIVDQRIYEVPDEAIKSITDQEVEELRKYSVDNETKKHRFLKAVVMKVMQKECIAEFKYEEDYLTQNIRFDFLSKDKTIGVECGITRISKFVEGFTLVDEMWYIPYPKKGEKYVIHKFIFCGDKEILKFGLKQYITNQKTKKYNPLRIKEISDKFIGKW